MAHDVFICHSSRDKTIADAVCATLEARGIRCWISPRDVMPGTDYASSIIDAIGSSSLVVLVFSSHSNGSGHVGREIERAVSHGIPILPFRVEAIEPSPALEYYISVAHWLDAFTPPLEEHLVHLAGTVRLLLDRAADAPAPVEVPSTAEQPATPEPVLVPDRTGAEVEAGSGGPRPMPRAAPPPTPPAGSGRNWATHWDDSRVVVPPAGGPALDLAPAASGRHRTRRVLVAVAAVVVLLVGAVVLVTRGGGGCDPGPGADLAACELAGRDLRGADLRDADLQGADLTGADLSDATLDSADLRDAILSDANLGGASLREASLGGADLSGADLTGADLTGARARDVDLSGASVAGTVFAGAELDRSTLSALDLSTADLSGADLAEAHLDGANLSGLDLSGVSLAGADLSGANLTGAVAVGADFEGATMAATVLDLADLSGATGVTDEMLLAALGVPADQLPAQATVRGIRLDSFDTILAAVAAARDGGAVAGAATYTGSDAFHPTVVLGPGPETTTPDWAAGVQSAWAPTGLRFAELVVVAGADAWETIEVCEYTDATGAAAPPITRYVATTTVQILAASDGHVVAEQTYVGTEPRACEANEPYWLEELRGEVPDLATLALPWIETFVHPPSA